ncbi:DUF4214 domain-containing protein [Alsobacter sp. SYSU BS001988]
MSNADVVRSLYRAIQFRDPPAGELADYAARLDSGQLTATAAQLAILRAPYTVSFVAPVVREYQAAFGRVPDLGGLDFWADSTGAGYVDVLELAKLFVSSAEFQTRYGAGTDVNKAFLVSLYTNVLGRGPDEGGLAYWLGSGQSQAQVLNYFAQSAEFTAQASSHIEAYLALSAAGKPPLSGSLLALEPAPTPGLTFALTTGLDSLVGTAGVDTFTATGGPGATFTSFDSVDGADGSSDVLFVMSPAALALPGQVTVKNVEIAKLAAAGAIKADLSTWVGLRDVAIDQSASDTVAMTTGANATSVSLKGGKGVTIADAGTSATDALARVSLEGVSGSVTLSSDRLTAISLVNSPAVVTLNNATAGHALQIDLSGSNLTVTDSAAETVNFVTSAGSNAASQLYVKLVDPAVKTIKVTGDVGIKLDFSASELKVFDASGLTKGTNRVEFSGVNAATILGGAGQDFLSGFGAGNNVDGGAGNDVLESGYLIDTLVGGDGNDDILINRGLHTVSGGPGADRFYVMEPAYFKQFSTITDASSGDRLIFGQNPSFQSGEIVSKYELILSITLNIATEGNATNKLSWFRFQGSTYVVQDRSAANGFDSALDKVIVLTGSIDLSKADFFNGEIILA